MKKILLASVMALISLPPCRAKSSLPDSLLTIDKAYTYTLSDTDTSLAILKTMRERHLEPDWQISLCEGDVYINNRQMRRAIPCYEAALGDPQLSDSLRMAIYKRLMDVYDLLQDHQRLPYYIYQLRELALKQGDSHFIALADFMAGKHFHHHGDRRQGYDLCRKALEMMKESTNDRRLIELRAFYAEFVKMYTHDGRYDDAMRASLLQEQAAREKSPLAMQKLDERALRRVYALRASMLAKAGRMEEADAAYAVWQRTTGGNAVDDREIIDYLIISGHGEEAQTVIRRYREFLSAQGDSISFGMLSMLYNDARVLLDQGQLERAGDNLSVVMRIADSLHVRSSRSQMSVTYQLLKEQKEAHRRQMVISWLVALLILLVIMALAVIYYNGIIRKRNKAFLKVLNRLEAYRNANIGAGDGNQKQSEEQDGTEDGPQTLSQDDDERLFVEMDRQVTRQRLFLKPDLSRDDLMRLIGVDKNRFGRMISRYSDASNASVYINTKRVEYGAQLIKSHPEYTIASIAEACGLQNTVTFNRAFKRVFGITPSEYRADIGASRSGSHVEMPPDGK